MNGKWLELTATAPTSFCKCTCAGNSTIIALDAPAASQKPAPDLRERASRKTCNDCNRQFCMGYSFCKGVKDEAVFTTCFRTFGCTDNTRMKLTRNRERLRKGPGRRVDLHTGDRGAVELCGSPPLGRLVGRGMSRRSQYLTLKHADGDPESPPATKLHSSFRPDRLVARHARGVIGIAE